MQMRGKRSLLRTSLQFWVAEGRSHPFCNSSVLPLECGGQRDNFSTPSASEGRLSSNSWTRRCLSSWATFEKQAHTGSVSASSRTCWLLLSLTSSQVLPLPGSPPGLVVALLPSCPHHCLLTDYIHTSLSSICHPFHRGENASPHLPDYPHCLGVRPESAQWRVLHE